MGFRYVYLQGTGPLNMSALVSLYPLVISLMALEVRSLGSD